MARTLPTLARLANFAALACLAVPALAQGPALDEIVTDHIGADTLEMIEVWSQAATTGYTVLVVDSDSGGNPGAILRTFAVGAVNGSHIWKTAALPTDTLPNVSASYLLVQGFSGSLGADLDANDDGALDSTPWTLNKDSVALSDGLGSDRFYSAVVLGPSFDGNATAPGGASRVPSGVDTDAVADWVRNDFEGAGALDPSDATLDAGEAWNTPTLTNRRREQDYWLGIAPGSAPQLRADLHARIDDHQRHDYTSSLTDTWDILEAADEDPSIPANIVALYLNESYVKFGGGTGPYNREHTWPQSMGFPDDGQTNSPRVDTHHLYLDDVDTNADRGSRPYGNCSAACTRVPTVATNGVGGVNGAYPSDSNWVTGSDGATGTFEVWNQRKGDVARAQLYMDVRYEGGVHAATGFNEPDLVLTDNTSLIASTQTGNNELLAYMGRLTALLQWHAQDPVDEGERRRNDVVWRYQGNRNPFVDHPEWVACVFQAICETPLFADGFESGTTAAWGATVP
jgi:endonuclease I